MYGIIMCFDDVTEERIRNIWSRLAESGISTYHIDKNGSEKRPHVTLADYDVLDVPAFKESFQTFFSNRQSFEIDLSILGTFPGGGTLFLTPVMTKELFHFHQDYHQAFKVYKDTDQSYYLPGRWVPHCTIANHLDSDHLTAVFEEVSKSFSPIKAKLCEVVLIKLIIAGNGDVLGSEPLISYRFNE